MKASMKAAVKLFWQQAYLEYLIANALKKDGSSIKKKLVLRGKNLSSEAKDKRMIGVQNARCRDLVDYLTMAFGLKILNAGGRAKNEEDGTVSLEVEGTQALIDGMATFLRAQEVFWVNRLNRAENVRVFNPLSDEGFKEMVGPMLESWGVKLERAEYVGGDKRKLQISVSAPWEVLRRADGEQAFIRRADGKIEALPPIAPQLRPSAERWLITNPPVEGNPFDNLSRLKEVHVKEVSDNGFVTEPFMLDKMVWIAGVQVQDV